MRFRDEYRDPRKVRRLARAIARTVTRPRVLMEVCGGQTHAIVRFGLDRLLPETVTLLHGPGCPVCVTPVAHVDKAIAIARTSGAVLCTYGDMLRVPGSAGDLAGARARGGEVRVVYSPLDALELARRRPDREVVFFAVGFETTAPANAMAVWRAKREGIANFSMLVSQVLVPPALRAILGSPNNRVEGFLAAGHVCTVVGYREYEPIAARYRVPVVVTGFEPVDILEGVLMCLRQLEEGRAEVENQYARSVRTEGNREARRLVAEVFRVVPRHWRGIGTLPESGLALAPAFAEFDAVRRFGPIAPGAAEIEADCIAGLVLRGERKPPECPAFGGRCTPERPLGVTMVSSEGACAAYYRYRRGGAGG